MTLYLIKNAKGLYLSNYLRAWHKPWWTDNPIRARHFKSEFYAIKAAHRLGECIAVFVAEEQQDNSVWE